MLQPHPSSTAAWRGGWAPQFPHSPLHSRARHALQAKGGPAGDAAGRRGSLTCRRSRRGRHCCPAPTRTAARHALRVRVSVIAARQRCCTSSWVRPRVDGSAGNHRRAGPRQRLQRGPPSWPAPATRILDTSSSPGRNPDAFLPHPAQLASTRAAMPRARSGECRVQARGSPHMPPPALITHIAPPARGPLATALRHRPTCLGCLPLPAAPSPRRAAPAARPAPSPAAAPSSPRSYQQSAGTHTQAAPAQQQHYQAPPAQHSPLPMQHSGGWGGRSEHHAGRVLCWQGGRPAGRADGHLAKQAARLACVGGLAAGCPEPPRIKLPLARPLIAFPAAPAPPAMPQSGGGGMLAGLGGMVAQGE